METLLALLHLAAFLALGIALPVPAVRRAAIALLCLAAAASLAFGIAESGERTLETVHSYAGFAGHDLEVSMVPFPTGTVTAQSPKNPSSRAPMSIDTMSPSTSFLDEGMPCTTWSLIDAQTVAG